MNILKDFGVNPVLLIAQIVNFLIILYLLKRFMYKPVLNMLKKREEDIKKGLKDSEAAENKLVEADEKEKQILRLAHEKADKIVNNAKTEANEAKLQIEESARKESEKIIEQARLTVERETEDAEERLTQKIGAIAISLLEKSLTGIFGEKEQKLIMKKASAQLEKQKSI